MAYEMQEILRKCAIDDFRALAKIVHTYVSPTEDRALERAIDAYASSQTEANKGALTRRLEREIRYLGSSDVAHLARWLRGSEPAGASAHDIIRDVNKKLKVNQKLLGSVEAKLERLVREVVEKTFFDLSPQQQRDLFDKAGLSGDQQREFFERIKSNKVLFFPILNAILGPEIVAGLIQRLVLSIIAQFIGTEAARELLKHLALRFPWAAQLLGPFVWGVSIGWLALDLQGPAYRKTIPALLYLGIVGLRDGEEPA